MFLIVVVLKFPNLILDVTFVSIKNNIEFPLVYENVIYFDICLGIYIKFPNKNLSPNLTRAYSPGMLIQSNRDNYRLPIGTFRIDWIVANIYRLDIYR